MELILTDTAAQVDRGVTLAAAVLWDMEEDADEDESAL